MRNGLQCVAKAVGDSGCYVLCLAFVVYCEQQYEVTLTDIQNLVSKGYIRQDMFVKDPIKVLDYFGIKAKMVESGGDYVIGHTGEHFIVVSTPKGESYEPSVEKPRSCVSYRRFVIESKRRITNCAT